MKRDIGWFGWCVSLDHCKPGYEGDIPEWRCKQGEKCVAHGDKWDDIGLYRIGYVMFFFYFLIQIVRSFLF